MNDTCIIPALDTKQFKLYWYDAFRFVKMIEPDSNLSMI